MRWKLKKKTENSWKIKVPNFPSQNNQRRAHTQRRWNTKSRKKKEQMPHFISERHQPAALPPPTRPAPSANGSGFTASILDDVIGPGTQPETVPLPPDGPTRQKKRFLHSATLHTQGKIYLYK